MGNTGGARAWQLLRRNPDYIEAWRKAPAAAANEPALFPLRAQTEADREAAGWGLLVWEDPLAEDGPASPFWAEAPTLKAMPAPESPALSELLESPEARLSGLRIAGGAVILKVEQGDRALQIPDVGAPCVSAQAGIRTGGAGQPAFLP